MAANSQKLSKPQESLLRELPRGVADNYAPIKKLVALGLASIEVPGKLSLTRYVPTPSGEEWLRSHPVL